MFRLQPVFKQYIWGGNKLKSLYGKESQLDSIAESWELSTHKDGECVIAEGPQKGRTLSSYIKEQGKKILGDHSKEEDGLPILIKLIDAKENLSVQVHPDDSYALTHEKDLGKTEMWYVLEAQEGAQLVYGLKEDITKEDFKEHIEKGTLTEVLHYVPVQKGDVFFISPGTIHAIGEGIMIAEIQQSSNVTYRVYDYGRVGIDGKPRELHIDKAMEVATLKKEVKPKSDYVMEEHNGFSKGILANCDYFKVELFDIVSTLSLEADNKSFHSLLVLEGELTLSSSSKAQKAKKGDSFFIPAGYGRYLLQGNGKVILTTV